MFLGTIRTRRNLQRALLVRLLLLVRLQLRVLWLVYEHLRVEIWTVSRILNV